MRVIVMWFLFLATIGSVTFQELYRSYNTSSIDIELSGPGFCPCTEKLREKIKQDIVSFLNNSVVPELTKQDVENNSVLPTLMTQNRTQTGNAGPGHGACGCGGTGWRRVAYLNMSDQTQTCPPVWELITTPKRSCARPSNAGGWSCYSAMFPTQGIQYSHVCGRIIGYQIGQPGAFILANLQFAPRGIDGPYVDGVSLTYGIPRKHIWTFANAQDESTYNYNQKCPCTNINEQRIITIPCFIGNDYFCETGVPPGQSYNSVFYPDDPLWDGQGCGPTSTCCTFNNPPWFCKQLSNSTNADLEVRLCSASAASLENTPIELIEIYVK